MATFFIVSEHDYKTLDQQAYCGNGILLCLSTEYFVKLVSSKWF